MQLLSFHNDPAIKKKYLKRVLAHQKADEIVQGKYWEDGKGCAVGCTMEMNNEDVSIHQAMEDQLGIPRVLARLEDCIFEGLTNGEAKKFPAQFLKAIPVGVDLSNVIDEFMIWMLSDKKDGVIQYARPDGKKAIETIVALYKRKLAGEKISLNEWVTARRAAYAAAAAAADAAAYADAAYAAAAADAAYAAAAADADAAAYAAAYAKTKHYEKMAKKLIQLLKKAE